MTREDYDKMEHNPEFFKLPFCVFSHYLGKEWDMRMRGERHARTAASLERLGSA